MHFRLLSYNIHKGIGGVDRRYDLGRIVETIQCHQPDVAFLQEVDDGVPRSRQHAQAELLAAATGLEHFTYQRNVSLRVGHYGNAILSRFPLEDPVHIDLTVRPKKRRGALIARWRVPVGDITKIADAREPPHRPLGHRAPVATAPAVPRQPSRPNCAIACRW